MSKIPSQKHSDKELSELRARSAMQSANSVIVETYNKRLAPKAIIFLGYALPLVASVWVLIKKLANDSEYTLTDFYIMVIPIILALIIALWIALTRVLSRHNAAFILIISLFCCFPIVNVVNSNQYLKHDLMLLIGIDQPELETDPLLENESDTEISELTADEIRERLRAEEERIRKNRSERLLRENQIPKYSE